MPFEQSEPVLSQFYRQSDFHRMRVDPHEYQRLVDLWIMSMILRVRATKPESNGGPVGKAFLVSREFYRICEMLGLDAHWTKEMLRPYAGNTRRFPRLTDHTLKGSAKK